MVFALTRGAETLTLTHPTKNPNSNRNPNTVPVAFALTRGAETLTLTHPTKTLTPTETLTPTWRLPNPRGQDPSPSPSNEMHPIVSPNAQR